MTDATDDVCDSCWRCLEKVPRDPDDWFNHPTNRMILCPTCGNKRCPKATDHRNACPGSNAPGQAGSYY